MKEKVRGEKAKKEAEEGFFEVVAEAVGEIFGVGNIGRGIGKAVDKFFGGLFSGWWQ